MNNQRRIRSGALAWFGMAALAAVGCGQDAAAADNSAALSAVEFTGTFTVSATDATVGQPLTVTQSVTNNGATPIYPVIIGIYRAGFQVARVSRPATGICRGAGSTTCNFVNLAPGETQSYTLTLLPTAPGTYQLRGWTRSSYVPGGSSEAIAVTVR